MPKPKINKLNKNAKQKKNIVFKKAQIKVNEKQQRKKEEDCVVIEPYIEVVELVENSSKDAVAPAKERMCTTKSLTEVNAVSAASLESVSSKMVKRRRSLRLLSMRAIQ
ncbi:unnamed protein product [Ceratitis capitata]|uniref:(Mediterranean fruit fly) hypothetical protein n=1 Tax=Ceratitis capitata TaxID=7213 RepID=W8BQ88_CERCA|nr:unnamed protein product [Ceratitis capitata]